MQNQEETGPYIWLRYTTQFQKDGQTQTIDLSVPVPVGASAELREQLIREAEAGMVEMVQHVSKRLPSLLARSQVPAQATGGQVSQPQPAPAVKPSPTPAGPRPATVAAAPQASVPVRESRPEPIAHSEAQSPREEIVVPPTRPNIGASMPLALGPTLDSSGNLSISEFIKYIRENLNLDGRQAMQMLNVRSLQGVNLREALDRLKVMAPQSQPANPPPNNQPGVPSGSGKTYEPPPARPVQFSPPPAPADSHRNGLSHPLEEDDEEPQTTSIIEMRIPAPSPRFDEEEDPDEGDALADETQEIEDSAHDFSSQLLEQAHTRVSELREHQGASIASAKRLQALNNVMDTQLDEAQLQELVFGIWNVSALKKLKVDQVEGLISWAKQDYFLDEVEAVLFLLEEERYARGNR